MPNYSDFNEAYEITKTLEIVTARDFDGSGGHSTVRIEILHCLQSGTYSVRWSQETSFHLQPYYPVIDGKFTKAAGEFPMWAPLDMPSVDEKDEDQAIRRALSWLKERGA